MVAHWASASLWLCVLGQRGAASRGQSSPWLHHWPAACLGPASALSSIDSRHESPSTLHPSTIDSEAERPTRGKRPLSPACSASTHPPGPCEAWDPAFPPAPRGTPAAALRGPRWALLCNSWVPTRPSLCSGLSNSDSLAGGGLRVTLRGLGSRDLARTSAECGRHWSTRPPETGLRSEGD